MPKKYKPGSFSKNFAWQGTGLRKLYDAIRAGFNTRLSSVERLAFRRRCGISDDDLQLIPINFFLFNAEGSNTDLLLVDELVFQAVSFRHSLAFDRLALFALHLSCVGKRSDGSLDSERPTEWMKQFVLDDLGRDGWWRANSLDKPHMDNFFSRVLDAEPKVRIKCRTNYRHLFELCQFLPAQSDLIDTGSEEWMGSALFLSWDRGVLSGQLKLPLRKSVLVDHVKTQRLYRLLGVPQHAALSYAKNISEAYIDAHGVKRFISGPVPRVKVLDKMERTIKRDSTSAPKARMLFDIENERRTEIERRLRESEVQIRNARLSSDIKRLYEFACMFCGEKLQIALSPPRFYVEGAHIKPVGKPNNGPDIAGNMLVLCPNHHRQFDKGMLTLERVAKRRLKILSQVASDPLQGKTIKLKSEHSVDDEFIVWHSKKSKLQQR